MQLIKKNHASNKLAAIFIIMAMLVMSVSFVAPAQAGPEHVIEVSSGSGTPGETVSLTLTLGEKQGLAGVQYIVNYDKNQFLLDETDADEDTFVDSIVFPVTGTRLANNQATIYNNTGKVSIASANANPYTTSGPLKLVTLELTVKPGAINGTYPITISDDKGTDGLKTVALGTHIPGSITITGGAEAPSSEKAITAFSFANPAATGVVDEVAKTVALTVPYGTDVTNLVPTIAVSEHATVSPASGVAQDFTNPVTYTVTAQDLSTQTYAVTVNIAPASDAKDITSFVFSKAANTALPADITGTIDGTNITATVPFGTNVTALKPTIAISPLATVAPNTGVAQNFTSPVDYTVTAQDGTTKVYKVTVNITPGSSAKDITSFVFTKALNATLPGDITGTISGTNITATVPFGTDVTYLVPTIAISPLATVNPPSETAQIFTNPLTYTVTAQDSSTKTYTVTVNITAPSTNNNLSALVLRSGTTVIDFTEAFAPANTTYKTSVGNAIDKVTVTPTVADATAAVTVNGAAVPSGQASGAINLANTGNTPNAITVVVTAQSGATKTYTINVFRAKLETPGATDTVTVPADTPVTVDAAQGAKIDVDETQALPLIEVNTADSTVGTIQVSIPAGTTVSGPAGWTGEINLPKVVTVPLSDVTGAGSVAYAIEVGTGDTSLTFSQAVRILMPGAKGKRVGVISGGVFTEITALVAADTQAEGNKVTKHGKIEVGNDVAIWTKHFTKFVVYTPATTPPTSGGGGGGGGGATPFNGTSVTAADGGTVSNSSLGASVVIPAKAMASNFKVRVEKASTTGLVVPDNSKIVGDVVEIFKDETANFSKAVTVKLSFDKSKVNLDENTLSLYWYNTSTKKWVELDNVKVDAEAGKVSGEVKQFAKFAILATTKEAPVKPEPKPETPKVTLTDIAGHWAQADIQKLVAAGAISGYPNKTFKPNNNITRAEFAVTLVKALKLAPKSGKVFNDTAKHWAKDSIATAQAYGIISGYSDTKFGPNDNITREQMAVMITKAANLAAKDNAKTFTDSAKVSAWAKDAVIAASSNGIISGYPDGSFKPKANATRAEAASMIVKIMK